MPTTSLSAVPSTAPQRPVKDTPTARRGSNRPRQLPRPVRPARPSPATAEPASASVLDVARRDGPVFRDELVAATGLSNATVNRQVTRLLEVGLLRERPDLVPVGVVGRPRVPVEVNPERFGVLGLHIGLRHTTLAVSDLRGRVLGARDVPNPTGEPAEVVAELTRRLRAFAGRWPERIPLRLGLVVGGVLPSGPLARPAASGGTGAVRWDGVPFARIADQVANAELALVPQVEAMASAEAMLSREEPVSSTLYVYAREAVGAVLGGPSGPGGSGADGAGAGTIAHLPVGGDVRCHCGRVGCLEASVGDSAVAEAAHRAGIVPEPSIARVIAAAEGGDRDAHQLLLRRARLLGRGVALARDVLNPRRVVLMGQAFTGYRPGLAQVATAFASASVLEPMSLRVSSLGSGIQALAACTSALRAVYADPLSAVRKALPRHTLGAETGGYRG